MTWQLYQGDCLEVLRTIPDETVYCVVTSPPYWGLRDYGVEGQIGLEESPEEYVAKLIAVFREVWRVLRRDGTLWLNLGDTFAASGRGGGGGSFQNDDVGLKISRLNQRRVPPQGYKPKDLCGIPWRVAFALQANGWYLRSDIIWFKPNAMPESVTDRPTRVHEYIFLITKSERYFYDAEAIKEDANFNDRYEPKPKRNKRSVWNINTKPFPEAHFATFPPELPAICILAGCPEGGTVLDPFAGSGTTLYVAEQLGRNSIGIELNPEYCEMIRRRMTEIEPSLFGGINYGFF